MKPELTAALREFCAAHGVRIIDSRDAEGEERLHHVLEKLRAERGGAWDSVSVPVSLSGANMRGEWPQAARDVRELLGFVREHVLRFYARAERARLTRDCGMGASIAERPRVLEVCNYGATLYAFSEESVREWHVAPAGACTCSRTRAPHFHAAKGDA